MSYEAEGSSSSPPIPYQPTRPSSRRGSIYNSFQDILSNGPNSLTSFQNSFSRSTINHVNSELDFRPRKLSIGSLHRESSINEQSRLLSSTTNHEEYTAIAEADEDLITSDEVFGFSTVPQTIFNGINTLIGIGLLSLPMGMYYSGWIAGSIILLLCALSTKYTAKVLAKCILKNDELKTYGDIARYCFGDAAHAIVVFTFSIDLLSAGISMIIIFADSFNAVFGLPKLYLKLFISLIFFVLSFIRLDVLSNLSLLGIISTTLIVLIILVSGLISTDYGSLLKPAQTSLWPNDTLHLFLSLGIFMSPFGGHAIFPELYNDMRHPNKYDSAVSTIFQFTWLIDYLMGALGYMMFGSDIEDQITKNVIGNSVWWVKLMFGVLLGILPITKGALITRPIITLVDQLTLKQGKFESTTKFINRVVVILIFAVTSLIFTNFGLIMSFLGSAICFAICIIYPLSFYYKLYHKEFSTIKKYTLLASIVVSFILAVCGTVAVAVST